MQPGRLVLFRAVMRDEHDDIVVLQGFRNPPGIETNYFAESLSGAERFAELAASSFDDGPFWFVRTSIEVRLLSDEHRIIVDGGIVSVALPTKLLMQLERPENLDA